MKKPLLPMVMATALLAVFVTPTSSHAAPSFSIAWDSQPIAGQASPGFTFTMSGVLPSAGFELYSVQLFIDNNGSFWQRTSASGCNSLASCGIDSVTYDGNPITLFSVREWATSQIPSWENRGFLLTFNRPDIDSGGTLVVKVSAGQFQVPNPLSSGKPRIYVNRVNTSDETTSTQVSNALGTETVSAPAGNSASAAPAPQKQHVSTLNQNPAPGETVAMFGSYFGGVTEVYVGGVKVKILSKNDYRVNIRIPKRLSGVLDVELRSPLGSLMLPKHLAVGKQSSAGTSKGRFIVGGFAPNSRKLTAGMKERIDSWLDKNPQMTTLTCTGFTSLPRRATDVKLSTNRGAAACKYAKSQRPELKTSVSQGIEDPRPGSNIRRVRLVLTP